MENIAVDLNGLPRYCSLVQPSSPHGQGEHRCGVTREHPMKHTRAMAEEAWLSPMDQRSKEGLPSMVRRHIFGRL